MKWKLGGWETGMGSLLLITIEGKIYMHSVYFMIEARTYILYNRDLTRLIRISI